MYRINYSCLNLEQVKAAVLAGGGPVSASELSKALVSKEICIELDNEGVAPPSLKYSFKCEKKLVLTENGGEPVECAYGALELGKYVLFTHMVPGTLRGYTAVLDMATGRAAVTEMWFIDYEGTPVEKLNRPLTADDVTNLGFFVNREVERQVYKGRFVCEGVPAAESRFFRSFRLDNKMVKWDDDIGRQRVFTYVTNYFSTMVEVDTPDGEDVITFPSDYLQLDDCTFFYDVGEVEYAGRLSVEVIDLYTMKKIGMTMGINEDDKFEFFLYTAKGRYLGQFATFYDFNDDGDVAPPFMSKRVNPEVKGSRCTYRTSVLSGQPTSEEINALCGNVVEFEQAGSSMASGNKMEYSRQCLGRKITFRDDDGFEAELDFFAQEQLRFRLAGGDWAEAEYRAFQLDADLVYLGFHIKNSCPPRGLVFALDFSNGCATCIDAVMAGGADPHDVAEKYHFGYMVTEGVPVPRTRRHGFTRELLGRSFTWTYSKMMSSQHIYNSPTSYSWTIFMGGTPGDPGYRSGGFVWSSPCTYIKLRDDVYIMTWVEQKWSGSFTTAAMNLRIMHDCGFTLGLTHTADKLLFHAMGAFARDAGRADMSGVYTLRHLD